MFQDKSIDIGVPTYFLDDLKHQLELNPDMKASEILEELQAGRCLKNSHSGIPTLDNFDISISGLEYPDEHSLSISIEPTTSYVRELNTIFRDFDVQKHVNNTYTYKVIDTDDSLIETFLNLQKEFETKLKEAVEADKCNKALNKIKADFWRCMGVPS